jgi:copper chaperone CopZ
MHVQLHAPDITCEHCVATIRDAVDGVEGATFISGDPDARSFVVEVTRSTARRPASTPRAAAAGASSSWRRRMRRRGFAPASTETGIASMSRR